MGIYHDPRWNEILQNKSVSMTTPAPKMPDPRRMGYRSTQDMLASWKNTLGNINAAAWETAHRQARALVHEYYEECRALTIAIGRKEFKTDSNEAYAAETTFSGLSFLNGKIAGARSIEEIAQAREGYLKTPAHLQEYILDPIIARYAEYMEQLHRQDIADAALQRITGFRLKANADLRKKAIGTGLRFNADDQPICHMVAVAVDLVSGKQESGRAGHGLTKQALEATFGFPLPVFAANAFTTENPYNCAELEALHTLKTNHPGIDIKNVYFAAMMPGGSPIIPPCANCQRWIKANGAKAAKFDY